MRERGYEIVAQNWKSRACEIDIVAIKDGTLHCVEVKYRKSNIAGGGLDYVTKAKLKQMQFAAQTYAMEDNWQGGSNLAAIEVSGSEYQITNFIESIY